MLAKTTAISALKSPGEASDTEAVSVYPYVKCTSVSPTPCYNNEHHHQDSSDVYEEISCPTVVPDIVTSRSAQRRYSCGQYCTYIVDIIFVLLYLFIVCNKA